MSTDLPSPFVNLTAAIATRAPSPQRLAQRAGPPYGRLWRVTSRALNRLQIDTPPILDACTVHDEHQADKQNSDHNYESDHSRHDRSGIVRSLAMDQLE